MAHVSFLAVWLLAGWHRWVVVGSIASTASAQPSRLIWNEAQSTKPAARLRQARVACPVWKGM